MRWTDPTGNYYVVTKPDFDAVEYTYARIRPCTPRVHEARGERARIRCGDVILGRGRINEIPRQVLVSSTGLGFVFVDNWWDNLHRNVITLVSRTGAVTLKLRIADLYTREDIRTFVIGHYYSLYHWDRGGWIDEQSGDAIIVSQGGKAHALSFSNGQVREAGAEHLLRGIQGTSESVIKLALELAGKKRDKIFNAAARELFTERGLDVSIRIRAAVVLAFQGDKKAIDYIVSVAREPDKKGEEDERVWSWPHFPGRRAYATTSLVLIDRKLAIPVLRRHIKEKNMSLGRMAANILRDFGAEAVPVLLDLLSDASIPKPNRESCLSVLQSADPEKTVPTFFKVMLGEDKELAEATARALMSHVGYDFEDIVDFVDLSKYREKLEKAGEGGGKVLQEVIGRCLKQLDGPPEKKGIHTVRGLVVDPEGNRIRKRIRFFQKFQHGSGASWGTERTSPNGRFTCRDDEEGTLILGGSLSTPFWGEGKESFWIDRKYVKIEKGAKTLLVKLVARKVEIHSIEIVDAHGKPLENRDVRMELSIVERREEDQPRRSFEGIGYKGELYEKISWLEDGTLDLPVFFDKPVEIILSGKGFKALRVKVDPKELPARIQVHTYPTIFTGEVSLPWCRSALEVRVEISCGGMTTTRHLEHYMEDGETFRIPVFSDMSEGAKYNIRFKLEGYMPVVFNGVNPEEPLGPVTITFEKKE